MAEICESLIDNNIVTNQGVRGFVAGSTIYHSLWTRDFLYAAFILIRNEKWRPVIKEHLELLINYMDEDGLVPKAIDTMNMEWRNIKGVCRDFLGLNEICYPFGGEWVPTYIDLLGSKAIDSNLLVLVVGKMLQEYYPNLTVPVDALFNYYNHLTHDELIYQPPYSDFQDSIYRNGAIFGTNLLYWKACQLWGRPNRDLLKNKIRETFYDPDKKLYKTDTPQSSVYFTGCAYSVYENLLAVFFDFDTSIYPFIPKCFIPTFPRQNILNKAISVVAIGIPGYHDNAQWAWILGFYAIVAKSQKDQETHTKLRNLIGSLVYEHETVYDAYTHKWERYSSFSFKSEKNWTWGLSYFWGALVD